MPKCFSPEDRPQRDTIREVLTQGAARLVTPPDPADWEPSVADKIKSLGFKEDAARAFDLLPLVLVAWADGTIQAEERVKILDVLMLRGLQGTSAFTMYEALLEERPAEVYLQAALDVLRDLVADRADGGASVVELCIEVAAAASDELGSLDPISAEEREAIAAVAAKLGPKAHEEVVKRLGA